MKQYQHIDNSLQHLLSNPSYFKDLLYFALGNIVEFIVKSDPLIYSYAYMKSRGFGRYERDEEMRRLVNLGITDMVLLVCGTLVDLRIGEHRRVEVIRIGWVALLILSGMRGRCEAWGFGEASGIFSS